MATLRGGASLIVIPDSSPSGSLAEIMSSVNQNIDFLDNIDAMDMHAGTSGPRGGDARSTHAQAADPERHLRIHLTDPGRGGTSGTYACATPARGMINR